MAVTWLDDLLDALADTAVSLSRVWGLLIQRGHRAVAMRISINGQERPMQIPNDRPFTARVRFLDRYQQETAAPGAVAWSITDAALATLTTDPADDRVATGAINAGDGTFRVQASSGTLYGESEDLDITPGAAAVGVVQVELTPQPAQAARHRQEQGIEEGATETRGVEDGAQAETSQGESAQERPTE